MFIDDRNKENYVDIYPFIDDAKDVVAAARITVYTSTDVDTSYLNAFGRVRYGNGTYTQEDVKKLVAAFEEAFKIVNNMASIK